MKINDTIKEVIERPIPPEVISERSGGGGRTLSYISGSFVTDMLNHAFGYMWDWEVQSQWIEQSQDRINKSGGKGVAQAPVAHVRGILTVYFEDENGAERAIRKSGLGSKVVIGGATEQESVFKAADTDALKKAASRLGIGAQLYRNDDEHSYFVELSKSWTAEDKQLYTKEREFINTYITENELTLDTVNELVERAGIGECLADIQPYNIKAFAAFLEERQEAAKKTEAKKKPLLKKAE